MRRADIVTCRWSDMKTTNVEVVTEYRADGRRIPHHISSTV